MADNQLTWQAYLLLIKYHHKFLLKCALAGMVVGLLLTVTLLPPTYTSNAKLMIKGGKTPTFVTALESAPANVQALTTNGNPILTQIEVLNSAQLARKVILNLKSSLTDEKWKEYTSRYTDYFKPEHLAEAVELSNPANTDVVTLSLTSPDKKFSRAVLGSYIKTYRGFLQDINHEALSQQGQYIQGQIRRTERRLKQVREALRKYRMENQTVDLANETQVNIQQLSDLETQKITLDSQVSARRANVRNLRRMLGMSTQQGIRSVALGMNSTLADSQRALNSTIQEYQSLAVKYTDEHPTMQALKARIDEMQNQVQSEARQTVGLVSGQDMKNLRIADPVRSNLVSSLTAAEAELRGLEAQRNVVAANFSALKSKAQTMPVMQFRLAELTDEEQVLSTMVNALKQKAAESEFQASAELSNVVVIQAATTALKANFPRPFHIVVLLMMAGVFSGMGWLLYREWLVQQAIKPMEEHFEHVEATAVSSSGGRAIASTYSTQS